MAVEIDNGRMLIKRSSVAGTIPTSPANNPAVVNQYDHTEGGWLNTDIYVGELYENTADEKIWLRTDVGIKLISNMSGTYDFTDLSDTPISYAGKVGYSAVVNALENALEFVEITSVAKFTDLTDTPISYVGQANKMATVNAGETALVFTDVNTSLEGLTDFPLFSAGATGYALVMNGAGDALVWVAFPNSSNFMDLTTAQTAAGIKTFSDSPIIPTPTTDLQAATKKYVDDLIAAANELSEVLVNGNETEGSDIRVSLGDKLELWNNDGGVWASVYFNSNAYFDFQNGEGESGSIGVNEIHFPDYSDSVINPGAATAARVWTPLDATGTLIALTETTVPTTAVSTGKKGEVVTDSNYIYVCTADDTWVRSALTAW